MSAICLCVCRCNLQYKCSLLFAHLYRRNLLYTTFFRLVAAEASSLKTSGACCFPHCEWDYVYISFLCFHPTLSTFTFYSLQPVWFGRDLCVRQITWDVTVSSPAACFTSTSCVHQSPVQDDDEFFCSWTNASSSSKSSLSSPPLLSSLCWGDIPMIPTYILH